MSRVVHVGGAPPPADQLLARLLRDGLVTRTRDGHYHLRSYGRAALAALRLIDEEEEEA